MARPKIYSDEEYAKRRKESNRKWREKNRQYPTEYYQRNKDKLNQEQIERVNNYPDIKRDKMRKGSRRWMRNKRMELLEFLGGKCVVCDMDDFRILEIDHINNDGAEHRRKNRSFSALYEDVIKYGKEKYQILCASCNAMKEYNRRAAETGDGYITTGYGE